jgi:SSS family solute:Na+ symporter
MYPGGQDILRGFRFQDRHVCSPLFSAGGLIMQDITLGTIDIAIVVVYFLLVFAIGFRMAQRTRSADDLFLAGRRLGWVPIGMSLFASNISSTTMIGLAGAAYTWGIAVANYEWMAAPILVVFALFLVPLYLNARIGTVPEFLEYRYNRHVRRYFSLLTIVANIVVDTGAGSVQRRAAAGGHRRLVHRSRRTCRGGIYRCAAGHHTAGGFLGGHRARIRAAGFFLGTTGGADAT